LVLSGIHERRQAKSLFEGVALRARVDGELHPREAREALQLPRSEHRRGTQDAQRFLA
jgi:hypothetical protein